MASSLLTTDRRWAAPARKSGMTVLGKVPKPINLPSQRLENNGLDPNLELVPKGTRTWGSKPTQTPPNAWGSSSILTTKNDGNCGSPSHLNGRPSSGGGSRPSTAGSESLGSPNAWGPNSRPSSASGTFLSPHLPTATNRPRSADTRPGSSQLSRFADNVSESVKGSASHGHGFTLSTGDFPTLGSEKCSELNSQRGHSSKGRPTSSSGKEASQNDQGKSLTTGSNEVIAAPNQHVDILKTDQQHAHPGGAPFPAAGLPNECQQPQPYPPNFHMPPQFDSWRAPPYNSPEGMWNRGAAPGGTYRPVGPPGSFPVEPFGYYGQFPPNSEAAASQGSVHGGYHPENGDPYHPMAGNSYVMNRPVIPVRPVYQGPGPYDGYYGPRANFNNTNVRDPHFVGGPYQPGILNQFPNQNDKFHHGHSQGRPGKQFQREQLDSGKVQVFNRGQHRILHDNPDRRGGAYEMEKNAQSAPPLLPHPDGSQTDLNMRVDMKDAFGDRNRVLTKSVPEQRDPTGIEHPPAFDNAQLSPRDAGDVTLRKQVMEDNSGILDQPVIKKNAALMEKIGSLNNKTRNVDARNVPESASSKEFRRLQKSTATDSKADPVMKDVPTTAFVADVASASNQTVSVPRITSVLQRPPNVHTDHTVVRPSHSQLTEFIRAGQLGDSNNDCAHRRGDSSRNSLHDPAKVRSANKFSVHGQGDSSTTDSLPVNDFRNSNQHDQPPEGASQRQPAAVIEASLDYESQRAKMKELAVQRAKKLQAEEEERIKNQKAKALAKLEELNRRSAVLQKKSNDTTVETGEGNIKQKAGLDMTAKLACTTAGPCDVAAPDSLTALQPPNDKQAMLLVQPHCITHGDGIGKDPVTLAASSSAGNIQSNLENAVQKNISQSHEISVPKPKQGFRKKHVASEEKISGENQSILVGTGNTKKNVESSFETKTTVNTSHDDLPAPNKKGARHLRHKKKVEDAPVAQDPPVVFNEQNTQKVSTEQKTYTGGVIISSSIVPAEGTIVTVGSITVGGISLPSVQQECCTSSDVTPSTEDNQLRPQQTRKSGKHQHAVRAVEKPGCEGVLLAPVKQLKPDEQSDRAILNTAGSDPTQLSLKSSNDGENVTRTKRAEMERYVPKPLSKEMQQQNLGSNLQSVKTCVDDNIHDKEALERSSDAKVDPTTGPKKWEDKKSSKGHGKSHPSWRRRNTHESAPVVPNATDQVDKSHESKEAQRSVDQSQPIETERQELKQLKSQADTAPRNENSSAAAETVPLLVSGSKEHNASNRQRRHHAKVQRNETSRYQTESKDREGREESVYQSATTPVMDLNSSNHRNILRSDVKSSGVVSYSRAHWKPKSNSHPQGNHAVEGQVDYHGDANEMNSSKGSNNTAHQDISGKSVKRSDGADGKAAHNEHENLSREDGQQNNETYKNAEQKQVNPPVHHQGHHSGRYTRGGTHRGRGGRHLEYQPVGSYKPKDFQQNPSVDKQTEGPPASGPVFRERGHSRGHRPAGHFVKRNPASTSTNNTYQEE